MKIAVLGGTGDLGKGLVLRWSVKHHVIVGSRSEEKAVKLAEEYMRIATAHYRNGAGFSIIPSENHRAVEMADIVVFSVPYEYTADFCRAMKEVSSAEKIVISTVVPMEKIGRVFSYKPYVADPASGGRRELSAGEVIATTLGSSRVVSAFHAVPAHKLSDLNQKLSYDVLLASDDTEAVKIVSNLVSEIPDLRPLYAGPLKVSRLLESLTPLLLNLAIHARLKEASVKIV